MVPVSAAYGVIVGLVGTHMPQFSDTTKPVGGISPRITQAMITFGSIGGVVIVLGLAAAGVVKDPLAAISWRFPNAPLVLMGALVGAFLIGRPYPLFHSLFRRTATTRDPLYGAVAFSLQSIPNALVMSLLFIVLSYGLGGRLQRWLIARPGRAATLTASAFLVTGVFTFVYWTLRILGRLDYICSRLRRGTTEPFLGRVRRRFYPSEDATAILRSVASSLSPSTLLRTRHSSMVVSSPCC